MYPSKSATIYPLVLNSSNFVSGSSSTFKYTFPAGSVQFKDSKIAVGSVNLFYSWENITAAYGNNAYSLIVPVGAGTATLSITMPDGYYDISEINTYLQQQLITAGYYLVDGDGNYVYYAELVTNSTYYGIQFNSYAVPIAVPAGWSNPGAWALPLATAGPQLVIAANAFRDIIGFNAGTYPDPAVAITYSKLSDYTPQVTPVQSIVMTCNLLNNRYAVPSTLLFNFTSGGSTYGQLISAAPNWPQMVDICDGIYPEIEIQFRDQDFNALALQDTNLTIMLLVMS